MLFILFDYERLEDNPHKTMFGTGPEIAIFENIAPYVSFVLIDIISVVLFIYRGF